MNISPNAETLQTAIDATRKAVVVGKAIIGGGSMVELTQPARVEPIAVVSNDLVTHEFTPDILQTVLNIFVGYYLQAIAVTTDVVGAKVARVLDRLNPNRTYQSALMYSLEQAPIADAATLFDHNYQYRLPRSRHAQEDLHDDDWLGRLPSKKPKTSASATSAQISKDQHLLTEASNLAVGKLIHVTVRVSTVAKETHPQVKKTDESGEYYEEKEDTKGSPGSTQDIKVPVVVRIAPVITSNKAIVDLMTLAIEDTSLSERWHAWRAGRISFIKDLIFSQDIINRHKRLMMSDETGIYQAMVGRAGKNLKLSLITGNWSLATASNIFIISEQVAKDVEKQLSGKLTNYRVRSRIFDITYAMLLIVVDREWNRIRIYTRGIETYTDLSAADIKSSNRDKGPSIMDILQGYMKGQTPSF